MKFMKATDPWNSLRKGQVRDGLKVLEQNYDRDPTASHIMELGVAYLWTRQYEKARVIFRRSIDEHPRSMSSFYGMAGTVAWCLGDIADAVKQWRNGLGSAYADTNGLGVHLPLLLLLASLLKPGSFESTAALRLLREKSLDQRIQEWPGPIALLMLGELDKTELRTHCSGTDQVDSDDRRWLAAFYRGVLSYRAGKEAALRRAMRRLTDTSDPLWADQEFFLARMWSEEFFLARYEACRG
jgi:hypothetical protein